MTQMGAITVLLVVFLRNEVNSYLLPRGYGPWPTQIYDTGNDYETQLIRDISFPMPFIYTELTPNEHNLSPAIIESTVGNTDFRDSGIQRGQTGLTFPEKRAPSGPFTVGKRIHTCAFMRRLGLPIGLCFKGGHNRVSQKPSVQEAEEKPEQTAYAYLERQWPVHSMLGGGVGR